MAIGRKSLSKLLKVGTVMQDGFKIGMCVSLQDVLYRVCSCNREVVIRVASLRERQRGWELAEEYTKRYLF